MEVILYLYKITFRQHILQNYKVKIEYVYYTTVANDYSTSWRNTVGQGSICDFPYCNEASLYLVSKSRHALHP